MSPGNAPGDISFGQWAIGRPIGYSGPLLARDAIARNT
jgi:hypothetical protein